MISTSETWKWRAHTDIFTLLTVYSKQQLWDLEVPPVEPLTNPTSCSSQDQSQPLGFGATVMSIPENALVYVNKMRNKHFMHMLSVPLLSSLHAVQPSFSFNIYRTPMIKNAIDVSKITVNKNQIQCQIKHCNMRCYWRFLVCISTACIDINTACIDIGVIKWTRNKDRSMRLISWNPFSSTKPCFSPAKNARMQSKSEMRLLADIYWTLFQTNATFEEAA